MSVNKKNLHELPALSRRTPKEYASAKVEYHALIAALIGDFWRSFQVVLAENPCGLTQASERQRTFVASPDDFFSDPAYSSPSTPPDVWERKFGHCSPGLVCDVSVARKVPIEDLTCDEGFVSTLYFKVQTALREHLYKVWLTQTRIKPYRRKMKTLIRYSGRDDFSLSLSKDTVESHINAGMTTAQDFFWGGVEVVFAKFPDISTETLTSILKSDVTIRTLLTAAGLSFNQGGALLTSITKKRTYASQNGVIVSRPVFDPDRFEVKKGGLYITNIRDFISIPVDNVSTPHLGCPALRSAGSYGQVIPEMWNYTADLCLTFKYLQNAPLRERVRLKLDRAKTGETLPNQVFRQKLFAGV